MGSMSSDRTTETNEDKGERINRELIELLNELRVALPGVQVLFAFLLAVPFTQRFPEATNFQRALFLVTLLLTAISSALLIAPSPYHRLHFRQRNKEELLLTSNRFAITGLGFLALAMTGAIVLVTDVIYGPMATACIGIASAAVFAWLWAVLPLRRRSRRDARRR
jgi:predicted MFS family arabinose efflux permease